MAKSIIPNPLERRHLVEKDLDAIAASKIADAYLEEGRKLEAIDFLAKANDSERLRAIAEEAIKRIAKLYGVERPGSVAQTRRKPQARSATPPRPAETRCAAKPSSAR